MAIFLEYLLCYYSRSNVIYHDITQNIFLSFLLNFFQTAEEYFSGLFHWKFQVDEVRCIQPLNNLQFIQLMSAK